MRKRRHDSGSKRDGSEGIPSRRRWAGMLIALARGAIRRAAAYRVRADKDARSGEGLTVGSGRLAPKRIGIVRPTLLAVIAAMFLGLLVLGISGAAAQDAAPADGTTTTFGPLSGSASGDGPMSSPTGSFSSDTTATSSSDPPPTTTPTTSASSSTTESPTISSDKPDYSPGSTVTITGAGWPADESVDLQTDDDLGRTWSDTGTATTDANGGVTYRFQLPNNFIAQYRTTATDGVNTAETTFTDAATTLQGQSNPPCTGSAGGCDSGWDPGNLSGWAENNLIPMRSKLTGSVTNEPFQISFDRSLNNSAGTTVGVENLTHFQSGSGTRVSITAPTLCDNIGSVWAYCFKVTTSGTVSTANPAFVTFSALMAVGAHSFTGSSMAIGGDLPNGMGNVQIAKPAGAQIPPGHPDLRVVKSCTVGCSVATSPNTAVAGTTVTYRLDYSNLSATDDGTTVVLRDILGSNETYVGCSDSCSHSGGSPDTLTWNLGSLAHGASGFVTVQAQLTSTASVAVTNEGNITSPQTDSNTANNDSQLTTTTQAAPPAVHTTSTNVSCSPNPVTYGASSVCTATVTDTAASGKTAPTGTVTFNNGGASGTFIGPTCTLGSPTSTSSSCSVGYTPSAVGTGTHAIGASYGADSTHSGSSGSTNLTVAKAAATVKVTWADPQTYTSSSHPASATVDGVGGETNLSPAATLEYFSGSTAGVAGTGSTSAPTNAGTYTVRASFAGNGNYNGDSAVKTIVIAKAAATVKVTWADATYDNGSHPASATVDGVGGETNLSPAATLEYFSGSTAGAAGTGSTSAPTNAGTYTVRASFAGNGNYNGDSAVKTIVIAKAAATVKDTWADATYDNGSHPASATVDGVRGETNLSPAATLEYFSGSTAGVAGTSSTSAPTNAGTYTVRASFAGNGNYNGDSAVKTIVIAKAAATVKVTWADPQTYTSSSHPASATVDGVGG